MGRLTTHVLDTAHGLPAAGVVIRVIPPQGAVVEAVTNADGRCERPLLEDAALVVGAHKLVFLVGDYFRARGVNLSEPAFFDDVEIAFSVPDAAAHYHVPLLVSPYGYSTYRGS